MPANKLLKASELNRLTVGGIGSLVENTGSAPTTNTKLLNTSGVQSRSGEVGTTCKFDTGNSNL